MDKIETLYYLRDAIACVGILIGMGGAIFLFIRKKTLPGSLTLIGMILLGVEPILDIVLWRIISRSDSPNWDALNTTYACITGPALFLGVALLVAALLIATRAESLPPPPGPAPSDPAPDRQ